MVEKSNFRPLTDVQKSTLYFIDSYTKEKGFAPTRKDIAEEFDIYTNAAADRVKALVRKKAIKCHPNISRGIVVVKKETERVRNQSIDEWLHEYESYSNESKESYKW